MSASKPLSPLEQQLTVLAERFISELLGIVQAAPLGALADFVPEERHTAHAPALAPAAPAPRRKARPSPKKVAAERKDIPSDISKEREEQLADEILDELETHSQHGLCLTRRELAEALNVPADMLRMPLKRLRATGHVLMNGDRQNATYSLCETSAAALEPTAASAPPSEASSDPAPAAG